MDLGPTERGKRGLWAQPLLKLRVIYVAKHKITKKLAKISVKNIIVHLYIGGRQKVRLGSITPPQSVYDCGKCCRKFVLLKGARGFLKPFKRVSYKPHAAITSCSVFLRTLIYPFLAAIVVFARKHAEEKEQCLLFSTR